MGRKKVYTIGHSTHTTREFMKILKSYGIETLIDVRHYPGSRYCPQFGKARLRRNLTRNKINYIHLVELGGRRRVDKESDLNSGWRNAAFKGYADYMQTKEFKEGLKTLISHCRHSRVAFMCSEAVPWRCHRSMIADAMIVHGFEVLDIFTEKNVREHKLTSFAEVKGKKITYPQEK